MARKQLGSVDHDLLARVDARAATLGMTRRAFVEQALETALSPGFPGAIQSAPSRAQPNVSPRRHLPRCACAICKPPAKS